MDSKKMLLSDSKSFKCCRCFHVKTATLVYGILTVLLHLFLLGVLILASIHPDVLVNDSQQPYDGIIVVQTDDDRFFERIGGPSVQEKINRDNLCVMLGITLAWVMAVLCLIYGVVKNRASYLIPCSLLQVFDFCLSCMAVVGCFSYIPDVKEWFRDQGLDTYPPFDHLMCLDRDTLTLLLVSGAFVMLSIKAYIISMVFNCYQYIQLFVASRSVTREYYLDPDSQMLMPPSYDDAIKLPVGTCPQPPAYAEVTE